MKLKRLVYFATQRNLNCKSLITRSSRRKGKRWEVFENSGKLQVSWSLGRKQQQRICSKKGIDLLYVSQDEKDVELEFTKEDEDSSVSDYSRICITVRCGNLDLNKSSKKTSRRMLHANVKDGNECVLEKSPNKQRDIW